MVRAYVLVNTDVGCTREVEAAIRRIGSCQTPTNISRQRKGNGVANKIIDVAQVTGPWDIIVHVEGQTLDELVDKLLEEIVKTSGVTKTTTCISVHLA